jgi:nitroreductase
VRYAKRDYLHACGCPPQIRIALSKDVLKSPTNDRRTKNVFDSIVSSRRSVRIFEKDPIPEAVVQKVLDWSLMAPNSSNLQPWEFYWVRDQNKREALVKACFSQNAAKTAAELFVFVARTDTWKKNCAQMIEHFKTQPNIPKSAFDYYKFAPLIYRQGPLSIFGRIKGVFFFFAGFFRPVIREPMNHQDLKLWAAKSTALACQNFMLGMRAQGFDTCPMEGLDSNRVKKILGLPRSSVIVMAIGAGKRNPKGVWGEQLRFPREQFIKIV